MIRAGDLREQVTFLRKAVARDGYGAETVTWAEVATVRAAVWPITGKEAFSSGQRHADATHRVRMRVRADINPTMRMRNRGNVFDVRAVLPMGDRKDALELLVEMRSDLNRG
jgi:SPP1 family predicted phage head-tail adaptor